MIGKTEEYIVSYAQNREDVLLAAFFLRQANGFYVDVGANDPEADSVTKYFYDRGWHGINIEPSPRLHNALSRARPRDVNLNVGVSDRQGKLSFREYAGHGLSTFSADMKKEHAAGDNPLTVDYRDYEVPVRRLDDIFGELKVKEIDFMKIDVEGYEYEVVTSNDWKKYRPRVVCIEANHIHCDWHKVLEKAGYTKVFFDGLNEYHVDTERPVPEFQYVLGVIGRPIVGAYADGIIKAEKQERRRLDEELVTTRNRLREAEHELERTRVYLIERTRARNLIKDLVRKIHAMVLVRLDRHTKQKRMYPVIRWDKKGKLTADDILQGIQAADRQAFVVTPPLTSRAEAIFFAGLLMLYRTIARGLMMIAKVVLKVMRNVRHG